MNAVGIDVSKGKSMVAIMRPFGEIVSAPFEIKHTASDIHSLVELINSVEGESRIVMEHTGRYYEVLAHQLSKANLFVSAINPKLIKDFDNDSLRKVKSDKADAVKIARYALDKWQNLKQYNVMDELRNQLKTMNRQFGFYMKHKTAMKNNLIGILDQTDVYKRQEELPFELPGEALAETSLFENERKKQLYEAMEELKPEYQEALYLVYFEDMSYQGTAEVMGRSESQIKNLVHRGKKSLKELLGKNGFEY